MLALGGWTDLGAWGIKSTELEYRGLRWGVEVNAEKGGFSDEGGDRVSDKVDEVKIDESAIIAVQLRPNPL